jgi:Fe-S-cluster containining protein
MAEPSNLTANLSLTVGGLSVSHAVTVPSGDVPATEIVPALQQLVDAVVAAAAADKMVSCRKGCGACCRQLVPVSRTEAERLLDVVQAMPDERKAVLGVRFDQAAAALQQAGLTFPSEKTDRELSAAYFALGIPCPFLEEESCSIHAERPLICREYLVTSPAALCSNLHQEGVAPLAVPKLSLSARGLQDPDDAWMPLALLKSWSRTRSGGSGKRRRSTVWVERFLKALAKAPVKG